MPARTVVFIMGAGHCGSTLLDLMLGSHPQAFSLGELHRLHQALNDDDAAQPQICSFCEGTCEYWNQRASIPLLRAWFGRKSTLRVRLGRALMAVHDPYRHLLNRFDMRVLIDSSKQPGWIRSRTRTLRLQPGIKPLLVYLVRDGRAVVNAYNRKYPERGVDSIARNWVDKTRQMEECYRRFPEQARMRVRYEDLATDPKATVAGICEAAGLEFTPQMLNYWAADHHLLMGNGGTKLLVFRYREKYGHLSDKQKEMAEFSKNYYSAQYYEQANIGIQLDERWKQELSGDQLALIDDIAGITNRAMGYT